jgi:hypothetical protein
MKSGREQGKVEILMPCQTLDPGRGSFMVHAIAVKKPSGGAKTVSNPFYDQDDPRSEQRLPVFRAAHHRIFTRHGSSYEPHPEAFDFAVYYRK